MKICNIFLLLIGLVRVDFNDINASIIINSLETNESNYIFNISFKAKNEKEILEFYVGTKIYEFELFNDLGEKKISIPSYEFFGIRDCILSLKGYDVNIVFRVYSFDELIFNEEKDSFPLSKIKMMSHNSKFNEKMASIKKQKDFFMFNLNLNFIDAFVLKGFELQKLKGYLLIPKSLYEGNFFYKDEYYYLPLKFKEKEDIILSLENFENDKIPLKKTSKEGKYPFYIDLLYSDLNERIRYSFDVYLKGEIKYPSDVFSFYENI